MNLGPDAPGVLRLPPEGMRQIDAKPRVIPELVDAIRKARAQYGEGAVGCTTP